MATISYTQKTLKALRDLKCVCGVVEKFNTHVGPYGIRQDLFGFIDIVALYPEGERRIVGVQSTGPSGHAEHRRKILGIPEAVTWLRAGGRIELWSWRKVPKDSGSRVLVWQPRIEEIKIEHFELNAAGMPVQRTDGVSGGAHPGRPGTNGLASVIAGLMRARVSKKEL